MNICGGTDGNWKERIIDIDVIVPHTEDIATITISSNSEKEASEG